MPFLLPTYYRLSHRERVAPAAVVIPPFRAERDRADRADHAESLIALVPTPTARETSSNDRASKMVKFTSLPCILDSTRLHIFAQRKRYCSQHPAFLQTLVRFNRTFPQWRR